MIDFSALCTANVKDLLKLHAAVLVELRRKEIVRSANNPLGDYAEKLCERAFNWSLQQNSASGHDAIDSDGNRYQIKSRRLLTRNASRQLGIIRRLKEHTFDYLVGVLFDADYSVVRAAIIPHNLIAPRSHLSEHARGHIFTLGDDVWALPNVRDVTEKINAAASLL